MKKAWHCIAFQYFHHLNCIDSCQKETRLSSLHTRLPHLCLSLLPHGEPLYILQQECGRLVPTWRFQRQTVLPVGQAKGLLQKRRLKWIHKIPWLQWRSWPTTPIWPLDIVYLDARRNRSNPTQKTGTPYTVRSGTQLRKMWVSMHFLWHIREVLFLICASIRRFFGKIQPTGTPDNTVESRSMRSLKTRSIGVQDGEILPHSQRRLVS